MGLKRIAETAVKAFIIGSTMTVPGISGGSMAMILGEYSTLLESVPGLLDKKRFRDSFIYLSVFLIAGFAGLLLISHPLSVLLEKIHMPMVYFFLGTVIATIPMIIGASGVRCEKGSLRLFLRCFLYTASGCIIVFSVRLIPEGMISPEAGYSLKAVTGQILGGFMLAAGFVLPGISISYLLILFGLYETILNSLSSFDILPLIPLGTGGVIGIFTMTGLFTWAMEKHQKPTYLMILGFLLGSVASVFPGLPSGMEIFWCIISLSVGFLVVYGLSKAEGNQQSQ